MSMKALIIGLGSVGQRHARNLRTLLGGDLELMAYRVRRLPRVISDGLEPIAAASVAEQYGIREYSDLQAALDRRPEAVFICNPSRLHIPAAIEAARTGANLFIEKPLSDSYQGVEECIELVEQKELTAAVGYQMRFHPCLQRLHSLLRDGVIGRVVAVRAEAGEYLPGWHPYEDYRTSYAARADLGGGVLLSQIHEMDYLYWMFGRPRRIFALGGKCSDLEIDVEDVASISMECVVDSRTVVIHLHQDYLQRPARRTCQVIGTAGTVLVDLRGASIQVYGAGGQLWESNQYEHFDRNQMFLDELRSFLDALAGKPTPAVTLRDAAQSLLMALAARRSLQTGRVVEL
jgi:predicted dehydrogenase